MAAAVGQTVKSLAAELPTECVLVSVRRNGKILIPHGSTKLEAGDRVTAFVATAARRAAERSLQGPNPAPAVAD